MNNNKIKNKVGRKLLAVILLMLPGTMMVGNVVDSTMTTSKKDTLISFDGCLKAKMEVSTSDGEMRFSVRNSRVGMKGLYQNFLGYRLLLELNNEGQFTVLDVYGSFRSGGLTAILGQTAVPFENGYIISPADMMFANRAFIGKYFTPGSRDLGFVLQYKFTLGNIPLEAQGGVFNGGKINAPTWTDDPSWAGRLLVGSLDKFRASAKIYRYNADTTHLFYWGADISYRNNNLLLQAEITDRHNLNSDLTFTGMYLQGAYAIPVSFGNIKYIQPALRWDAMGFNFLNKGFDTNRATFGINFGFNNKLFSSVIRLNYEQYFVRPEVYDNFPEVAKVGGLHALDNKFTVELLIIL